ncbi:MAG TPA: hypothetical protein VGD05_04380 [Pyrinomonadaceae bacterium]|jgi:hypothetical protein
MKSRKEEKGKERKKGENSRFIKIFFLLICVSFGFSCKPNSGILNSQRNNQTLPANSTGRAINSFERDLETMRTADFDFIFVLRRKDGGKLDGEDRTYIKANSPAETNRFIVSDEEKAVIAGSKFKFAPENLKALQERFAVENFSKPAAETPQNANVNANG